MISNVWLAKNLITFTSWFFQERLRQKHGFGFMMIYILLFLFVTWSRSEMKFWFLLWSFDLLKFWLTKYDGHFSRWRRWPLGFSIWLWFLGRENRRGQDGGRTVLNCVPCLFFKCILQVSWHCLDFFAICNTHAISCHTSLKVTFPSEHINMIQHEFMCFW